MSLLLPMLVLAALPSAGEGVPSQVTLPLSEFEALRKAQERASVTVVDTLALSGSFRGRDLAITFGGRAAGTLPAESVLAGATGVVLYGCQGEGILSRGENGTFMLTPLAARFEVRCRVGTRGSDRLELSATPAVLWIESTVGDGEFVLGTEDGEGGRSFSVVRRNALAAEGHRATAAARYRISLRPDETRFRYEIQVHNPNRSRQAFDVNLASGEHVQQVDAAAPYDVQGQRYRFELPPGESALVLSGTLGRSRFVPPVEASLHYCLIESHPLLRPVVEGDRKRVSPQEVGVAAEFRGAQAFLLAAGQDLSWTVTRLEALRTTSYALPRAAHVFFLSTDGSALGESQFTLDNQGAPDVSLPMSAEPTFASLQGDPVLLTRDAQGDLWLPIAQGEQQLLVQHRQAFRRFPGLARAELSLPQLAVPASNALVELRYPEDWFPVYEAFLSEGRFWSPGSGLVFGAVVLFIWTERALVLLGLGRPRRLVLAGGLVLAALAWGWALFVLVVGNLAVCALWLGAWMRGHAKGAGIAVGVAVAAGLLLLLFLSSVPSLLRARIASRPSYEYGTHGRTVPSTVPPAAQREGMADAPAPAYQGLPARFALPEGVARSVFTREMLETRTPRSARVWMVSRTALGWLQGLLVLAAAGGLAVAARPLRAGWLGLWADLQRSRLEAVQE